MGAWWGGVVPHFWVLATRRAVPLLAMSRCATLVRFMRTSDLELPHQKPLAEPPKQGRANHFGTTY